MPAVIRFRVQYTYIYIHEEKMDYKDTLNLPKTDFPMKANLPVRELDFLKFWQEQGIYDRLVERGRDLPRFILHDGPPYANGHIHIGHALNKILKDIIIKSESMEGSFAPYVPGWDCHGLPIELQVDKDLKGKKEQLSKGEFRRYCREYAAKFVDIQREEFKRLGVLGDWDNPYLTMDYRYEADIVREFGKFVANGGVFKGKKPIHWCASCVTALAEAEVEYADHSSPSVFVKFELDDTLAGFANERNPRAGETLEKIKAVSKDKPVCAVIWTTTPWTIPANLALSVHPDFVYILADAGDKGLLLMQKDLAAEAMKKFGVEDYETLLELKGSELEGLNFRHPFIDRLSPVLNGKHVTLEAGTGIVHTAPGHGQEDYEIGLVYGLDIYTPVDDRGLFTKDAGEFAGKHVFKANEPIIEKLREVGALLASEKVAHSYPHCWRCKNPVLFRATEQWFISMEQNGLREKALEYVNRVKWVPAWGRERIYGMIENRPDWCISRQRAWGVPITIFFCKDCGERLMDASVVEHVAAQVEAEGADIWFTKTAGELLPPATKCPACGGYEFDKEQDILDVWFDSGVSQAAVLKRRPELGWPADLYLEGSDQHRGWFQSSLLASVGAVGEAPYRGVLTHGFTVDGAGKKMSKSKGNVIAPQKVIDQYGAEILRLWVSASDYTEDIRISDEILKRLSEAYRRIRNTARYILGNLSDFDPGRDLTAYADMLEIDRWALHRFQQMGRRARKAYRDNEFHMIYHSLHNFCSVDMSAFYLDVLKDRLYTSAPASVERRSAQSAMYHILDGMNRLMAPVLSFTAEEVWSCMPKAEGREPSVHLAGFPEVVPEWDDEALAARWERILAVRNEVTKVLEKLRADRVIGHSLDAEVNIYADGELYEILSAYAGQLAEIIIISDAALGRTADAPPDAYESEELKGLRITASASASVKCERCWGKKKDVGTSKEHPTLCARCAGVLGG